MGNPLARGLYSSISGTGGTCLREALPRCPENQPQGTACKGNTQKSHGNQRKEGRGSRNSKPWLGCTSCAPRGIHRAPTVLWLLPKSLGVQGICSLAAAVRAQRALQPPLVPWEEQGQGRTTWRCPWIVPLPSPPRRGTLRGCLGRFSSLPPCLHGLHPKAAAVSGVRGLFPGCCDHSLHPGWSTGRAEPPQCPFPEDALCSSSTDHAGLATASPAPFGLNPIFPLLGEAAVLGHGPAASGCFSGIQAASAALEPAFFCLFCRFSLFFFLKAAKHCHLYRSERCCPERKTWIGKRGRKSLIQPFRAGPTTSIQPLTPVQCPLGARDIFLRDQSFVVCTPVPDAEGLVAQLLPW